MKVTVGAADKMLLLYNCRPSCSWDSHLLSMTTLTTGTLQLVDESDLSFAVGEINDLLVIHESNLLKGELTSQIKRMTSQFDDIRRFLSTQDPEYKRDTADVLLEVATNAVVDAKSIIDDFLRRTEHRLLNMSRFPFTKYVIKVKGLVAQREAIKMLEFIRIRMSHVFEREKQNNSMWRRDPVRETLSYDPDKPIPIDDRSDIVGREEDIKMIRKFILEDTSCFRVISVVGMAGTGKTTITREIYNSDDIISHFNSVAEVVYGPSLTISQHLQFIADKFNVIYDDEDVLTMKKRIYDYLINQRYFIVLDDIMTTEAWDDISEAFPMSQAQIGSRILLTTRNKRVALHATRDQQVGTSPPYTTTVGPLNENDSWELFKQKVRIHHHFSQLVPLNLEPICKEIVKKCDGLPGAIAQVAKAEMSSCENLLFSSTNCYQFMNDEPETPWSYIFKKIISDLPLHLKRCLFYFGYFPKNYKIPVRRLIGLWVAEGLVERNHQPVAADEYVRAREYLQELIDREMIQVTKENSNGRPMKCCLAFFLREHLPTRVRPGNHVSSMSSSVRHLVDDPKDNQPTILRSSKYASLESYRFLSSFMSFDFRKGSVPGEQIRGFLYRGINKGCFQLLRVLDLENVYKPILPIELGKLSFLRYLGLRRTSLDKIPSFLVNLFNLQTLDIKHTFINIFPNSVWKLKQLRHLCLNKGHRGASMDPPSALDNLQTLTGIYVKDDSRVEGGLDRLINLTKLALTCEFTSEPQKDAVAKWILKLTSLESLAMRSHNVSSVLSLVHFRDHKHLFNLYSFGWLEKLFEVNEFPPNLTELTLSASKLKEDPLPMLGKLPNLIILGLYSESYIGEQMVCPSSGFQCLRVLKIWKLEKLEILSFEGAMPVLNKLDIRWCKNLKKLPVGLQQIATLQELKLSDVSDEFKAEIEQHKDEEWYKKANVKMQG